jgi:hypothetical protein
MLEHFSLVEHKLSLSLGNLTAESVFRVLS